MMTGEMPYSSREPAGTETCLSSATVADQDELKGWWGLGGFSHGEGYVTSGNMYVKSSFGKAEEDEGAKQKHRGEGRGEVKRSWQGER